MKKKIVLILVFCLLTYGGTNSCPGFYSDDLLQSGKNAIMRGKIGGSPDYSYEAPINFEIPRTGIEIAVTTGTIGDYNPLPNYGYNYYIEAERKGTSNSIIFKLVMNNDQSWTSIQLSYLVSGRSDMSIGNFETPINQWVSAGPKVYNINYKINKNLAKANYKIAVFISGFSTTDDQFSLALSKKQFDVSQQKITVGFYCQANPAVLTLTLSYIIYLEVHPVLDISYELTPKGDTGSYQITGPVSFQPNKKIQYNQWRVQNRNLACTGNQCSNTCVLRQKCANNGGNIWQDQCIYCPAGIIFQFGRCSRKCGANQIYVNRVCVCANGFKRQGKDCTKQKQCGTNRQYSNAQKKCICKNGFANYKGQCRQCPTGSISTQDGLSCLCSSNSQIYDQKSNTCKDRCFQNQRWSSNKCQCVQKYSWWNQKCRICPDNSQVTPDQLTCKCLSPTAYFNPQINKCIQCGINFRLVQDKCVCQDGYTLQNNACIISQRCSNNEQYNPASKKCQCKPGYTRSRNNRCIIINCKQNQVLNAKTVFCDCVKGFVRIAGGLCVQPCKGDLVWDGKNCICPKGFANIGNCKKCPQESTPNAQRTVCICYGNKIFSISKLQCVQCPANSMRNKNLSSCICNKGFIKSGSSCISNCSSTQVYNPVSGKCQCNFGYYKPSNKQCVLRCKQNQQWNGNKCICQSGFGLFKNECTKCPIDATGSSSRTTCLCNLPNYIFNKDSFKCQACPPNTYSLEDHTKCICNDGFEQIGNTCTAICEFNEQFNIKTNNCECKQGFIKLGPLCVERCGLNQQWNGSICICKVNTVRSIGVCKPCPNGLSTNPDRTTCLCKDFKQFFIINKMICQTCPSNSILNSAFTDCNCLSGYKKEGDNCVNACPFGTTPDVNGNCVCSGGYILQGNACVKPITCPPDSTWDSKTLQCKCNTKGQFLINGECKSCEENSFFSTSEKKCICTTGFFSIGGSCRACDSRTTYNGTDCICNLGFYGNRDKCQKCHPSCSKCSGPEANQCQSCSDISLVLQKGFCSKNTPCDPGFFLDNGSCTKCSDYCIICDDLFKCQQCAIGYQIATIEAAGQKVVACNQVCGDGIKYQAECDDGNTKDGDGCSSKCTVEAGWTCSGGSSAQKSKCNKYIPDQTIITSKGMVNLGDRVVISVRASYLPTCLSDNQCNKCFKVLKVNVVNANVPILVKVNFIPLSQYQFLIQYNFQGLLVTSKFKTVIKLNQEFKGCLADDDFTQQLELQIDPAFLAKVDQQDNLSLDQIVNPSSSTNNTINVPADAKQILGLP